MCRSAGGKMPSRRWRTSLNHITFFRGDDESRRGVDERGTEIMTQDVPSFASLLNRSTQSVWLGYRRADEQMVLPRQRDRTALFSRGHGSTRDIRFPNQDLGLTIYWDGKDGSNVVISDNRAVVVSNNSRNAATTKSGMFCFLKYHPSNRQISLLLTLFRLLFCPRR